jgi:hypothetical protein
VFTSFLKNCLHNAIESNGLKELKSINFVVRTLHEFGLVSAALQKAMLACCAIPGNNHNSHCSGLSLKVTISGGKSCNFGFFR